ncbi:inorganic pyrophosphatase [Leptospira perdikensis]|uniref:inorganic diphosphatase n=1 Tax=Leptospira perdikensis TaxID=2484948 RepID=A0A4R9JDX6_9LEPT|nr:inorganic pyrophosphatase [Leptospira perdikensis]TGL37762.1 inorganic pyrophosphatase [Leptospira perdikensis]
MKPNYYVAHPWHGLELGPKAPDELDVFIELTPQDTVKYEIDKASGFIRVDRPQKYSNRSPTLYGFIPRTFSGEASGKHCSEVVGRADIIGDGDPIDICVLSVNPITHGNMILTVIPIGGLRMIDKGEADDKIVAVLKGDEVFGQIKDISEVPKALINKLHHYFLTYKLDPNSPSTGTVEITEVYDRTEAIKVIQYGIEDYIKKFVTV